MIKQEIKNIEIKKGWYQQRKNLVKVYLNRRTERYVNKPQRWVFMVCTL